MYKLEIPRTEPARDMSNFDMRALNHFIGQKYTPEACHAIMMIYDGDIVVCPTNARFDDEFKAGKLFAYLDKPVKGGKIVNAKFVKFVIE